MDGTARGDRRGRLLGPLAGQFKPMTGASCSGHGPDIRLRPWKWVPFTAGDRRTFDSYSMSPCGSLLPSCVLSGVDCIRCRRYLPTPPSVWSTVGLLIAPIALLVAMGLRDKIVFLAARGEQYLPALVFFAASCPSST